MYIYSFELTPAKRGANFKPSDYITQLNTAVEAINNGIVFCRDGKKITIDEINDKRIFLTLTCKTSLIRASRSLSALTRHLTTNYPDIFCNYIYNKTLFNIKLISQNNSLENEKESLSNEEILKGVIDLLYSYTTTTPTEAREREEAIVQISNLIKPYRITQ